MSRRPLIDNVPLNKQYVVRAHIRSVDALSVKSEPMYLAAVKWDPYNKGGDRPTVYVDDPDEAFAFSKIAAAEMAAVMVGGEVMRLDDAILDYSEREDESDE